MITPRPWRAGALGGTIVADTRGRDVDRDDDGSVLVESEERYKENLRFYGGHPVAESAAPDDVAHIVRVVNVHDDLVKALELCRDWLVSTGADGSPLGSVLDALRRAVP